MILIFIKLRGSKVNWTINLTWKQISLPSSAIVAIFSDWNDLRWLLKYDTCVKFKKEARSE